MNVVWNDVYKVDSKAFHPMLPLIATLSKDMGEIRYWNVFGKHLKTQKVGNPSGQQPQHSKPRYLSFSQDGGLLAYALDSEIGVVKVPEIVLAIK